MSKRTLHALAQDGTEFRGGGAAALVLGGCAFLAGLVIGKTVGASVPATIEEAVMGVARLVGASLGARHV